MANQCKYHSFLPHSQNTTIERPIALVPTLMRLWKWQRAPSVTECNITLDACSNFVGRPERTEWESLLEMESMDIRQSHQDNGAATSVMDLAKWALDKCVRAPAGGVPTYLARAAGYKDINNVLKYFAISESLINRTEKLEAIGECGSHNRRKR